MTTNIQEVTQEVFNEFYSSYVATETEADAIEWAMADAFRYAGILG